MTATGSKTAVIRTAALPRQLLIFMNAEAIPAVGAAERITRADGRYPWVASWRSRLESDALGTRVVGTLGWKSTALRAADCFTLTGSLLTSVILPRADPIRRIIVRIGTGRDI